MAIAPGAAVAEGFALIRREPRAVMVWGLLIMAVFAVIFGGYASFFAGMIIDPPPSGELNSQQAAAFFGRMVASEGLAMLGILIAIALRPVLSAAVLRAVLHPEDRRLAYLRISMAELYLLAVAFIVGFGANLIVLPFMMMLGVAGFLVYARQWIAAIVVGVVVVLACMSGLIYVMLRMSLVGPMIVDDEKFHLVDAWRLTKGHVGRLLGTGLLVALLLVGVELLVYALIGGLAALGVGVSAGGFDHLDAFFGQGPGPVAAKLWPYLIPAPVLGVPLAGCACAIALAPWARAYRDLVPTTPTT